MDTSMKALKPLVPLANGFAAMSKRDRVLATVAVAACIGLGGNLLALKPQMQQIDTLKARVGEHQRALADMRKLVLQIKEEEDKGVDPFIAERRELQTMQKQVREVDVFLGAEDSTASQIGILVRNLIRSNPDLSLVSLRTRPGSVFYTPPAPPKQEERSSEVSKLLDKVGGDKKQQESSQFVLVNKTIYKHGVDVTVKGAFPALMAYLQEMQRFPQRIFWAEVKLDAKNHREATLNFLVYTLSDQSVAPLN